MALRFVWRHPRRGSLPCAACCKAICWGNALQVPLLLGSPPTVAPARATARITSAACARALTASHRHALSVTSFGSMRPIVCQRRAAAPRACCEHPACLPRPFPTRPSFFRIVPLGSTPVPRAFTCHPCRFTPRPSHFRIVPLGFPPVPEDFPPVPIAFPVVPERFRVVLIHFRPLPTHFRIVPITFPVVPERFRIVPEGFTCDPGGRPRFPDTSPGAGPLPLAQFRPPCSARRSKRPSTAR